jgi:hypothetical protein
MLESPVLSGMYRSAAAVALARDPTKADGRIRPSRARIISRRRRRAIEIISTAAHPRAGIGRGNQMVKFTVNELPFGSDGIDIALPRD